MVVEHHFGEMAAVIGEKSRATMLWHLLGNRALTATELALCADVSPQSASMHLNKLVAAGLLVTEREGRHRYYRFSGPEAAYAIEGLATLKPRGIRKQSVPEVDPLRYCRACYDHLAGRVGVLLAEQLIREKMILSRGREYDISRSGARWFASLRIDVESLKKGRRTFARACLDWSERRHHLAGALGAALFEMMLASDWIRRIRHSRVVIVTSKGRRRLQELLKLDV